MFDNTFKHPPISDFVLLLNYRGTMGHKSKAPQDQILSETERWTLLKSRLLILGKVSGPSQKKFIDLFWVGTTYGVAPRE